MSDIPPNDPRLACTTAYILQIDNGDIVPRGYRLIGPFSSRQAACDWGAANDIRNGEYIDWQLVDATGDPRAIRVVSPAEESAARGLVVNIMPLVEALGRCPHCDQRGHAFNHVSAPIAPGDGAYGLCADCRVFWPVSTDWIRPETFDPAASQEITRTVRAICQLIAPPGAVIALHHIKDRKLPVARV